MNTEKYIERIEKEGILKIRAEFQIYYAQLEKKCKELYGKGDFLDWISENYSFYELINTSVIEIIQLEYIRDNNLNFQINPSVKNATNYLRGDEKNNRFNNKEKAVLVLIKQIRDNFIHNGKSQPEEKQYQRDNILLINSLAIVKVILIMLER